MSAMPLPGPIADLDLDFDEPVVGRFQFYWYVLPRNNGIIRNSDARDPDEDSWDVVKADHEYGMDAVIWLIDHQINPYRAPLTSRYLDMKKIEAYVNIFMNMQGLVPLDPLSEDEDDDDDDMAFAMEMSMNAVEWEPKDPNSNNDKDGGNGNGNCGDGPAFAINMNSSMD